MAPTYRQRRTAIADLLADATIGDDVVVTGWVKTSRFSKNVSFVHVFDGSTPRTVQVVLNAETEADPKELVTGAALRVHGSWVESPARGQSVEVLARTIEVVGRCDASVYPIQRKRTSFEFLRTVAHLRPRANTFQSVFRVRNALAREIHTFFQERRFLWIHTPIIAAADCEGAGELFKVEANEPPEGGFFGREVFLTVSGQLQVEPFCQAFSDVYTFGPAFRAENSNTARHAAEFWMIEPEMAFADLDDVISLAEDFVRTVATRTIAACEDDFEFFNLRIDKGGVDFIREQMTKPFARVDHHEAQRLLAASGRDFEFPVGPGCALQAEHERFLAEEYFKGPVFVTDYPKDQKAFYMRRNDDGETVAATDLLVPRVGEMIGGSQREERLDVLQRQIVERGMEADVLEWYLDLRRFGSVPHGGFGLGFERMLMWLTGMQNIRDVLPYPRTRGNAAF